MLIAELWPFGGFFQPDHKMDTLLSQGKQQFQVAEFPVEDQGAFSQQVFDRFKRPGVFLVA